MLFQELNKIKRSSIIMSISLMALGLVMAMCPEKYINSLISTLGCALIIVSIVMIHNLLGLAIGYTVGRLLHLQKPKCVALSIEVGMQNSGLASSLAVLHFAAYPLATIPGAVFSVWHNISGALMARFYSR